MEFRRVLFRSSRKKQEAAVGSKVSEISQEDIQTNLTKSLSEILWESSPIQIKSMGQGGMSTASFRGTSSSHTQVMWNGISINSSQLGSFDLSMVPIYFVDNINLYHGGSAQKGGSGALGGSINFGNDLYYGNKPTGSFLLEVGSNDTYTGAANIKLSKKRFTSSTRLFYQQSDNDYRYLNTVYQKEAFDERRQNEDYRQAGLLQGLGYRTRQNDMLSATVWWQYDDRSLPQGIYIDNIPEEKNRTNHVRTMLNYDGIRNYGNFNATIAYFYSDMEYQRSFSEVLTDKSHNINNSLTVKGEYNHTGLQKLTLTTILNYRMDQVHSENIEGKTKIRNTLNLTAIAAWRITPRLHIDARVPMEWSEEKSFARYNLSARYRVIDQWLTLKINNG